ncbi:MAG: excinuclease ABC subunit B [Deltaproteobacteria bacterium]|nr:MAG: excinuclease ABC subunit B [Deltaproteobacteria bacterium]
MGIFKLNSSFSLAGDQPKAVDFLVKGLKNGEPHQVLLGVTGSGKTFTMANVIEKLERPVLVMAPNKTLAAQLFNEFKQFFPENAVEYFVSYYDYYQPEAYIPTSDTYIQKDSSMNERIDKMRHSATMSLLTRKDVIIIASVSCIYGLGDPEEYLGLKVDLYEEMEISREKLTRELVSIQYQRNDSDFYRGTFRVRGDRVDIFPAYEEEKAVRVEFFGDEIEAIYEIDPLKGTNIRKLPRMSIFPGSHYVTQQEKRKKAIDQIKKELKSQISFFNSEKKLIEAQRIDERTRYDLEMMQEMGHCSGIENYSRHLTGREKGEPPPTMIDYFSDDFFVIIDESHIGVPQIRGMYNGDFSRKSTLVEFGFRLPSAIDNRPLKFNEFEEKINQIVYVSATPAEYELKKSGEKNIVEQIVRPTGLVDPEIEVRPVENQVDDLYDEIKKVIENSGKILVTTLTKRMAEDLTDYLDNFGIRVRYLHSDIDTLERIEIINDLRNDKFDVLIGINLLREGLDIPEVALVAILDADKEGFLRSERSLIQTFGRAARNVDGRVILYAERITPSMKAAISETERRRKIQKKFNLDNNITPRSVKKDLSGFFLERTEKAKFGSYKRESLKMVAEEQELFGNIENSSQKIIMLEKEMDKAASKLEFEKAARIRDKIEEIRKTL